MLKEKKRKFKKMILHKLLKFMQYHLFVHIRKIEPY
jgi:hypothetical protein